MKEEKGTHFQDNFLCFCTYRKHEILFLNFSKHTCHKFVIQGTLVDMNKFFLIFWLSIINIVIPDQKLSVFLSCKLHNKCNVIAYHTRCYMHQVWNKQVCRYCKYQIRISTHLYNTVGVTYLIYMYVCISSERGQDF